jgi:16S rRNA processing protein RimM
MIRRDELTAIGTIYKPHGINGEVSASFEANVDPAALRCIVLDCDGIFVPFFLNSVRTKGAQTVLLKIDGFENENDVAQLANQTIYGLTRELADAAYDDDDDETDGDEGFYASDFIGYVINDEHGEVIGEIVDLDDRTDNFLFEVKTPKGSTVYIPVADEYITDINEDDRTLEMDLPIGLIEL